MGMGVSAADDGSESGESGGAGAPSPIKSRLTDARAFAAISSSIEHIDDTINDNLPPPVIRHPPRRDTLDVMSLWKQCIFRMLDRNARTRATARDVVGYLRNLAAEWGMPAFGRLSLETILAGQPDMLVVDGESNADPARATELVEHHALKALAGRARIVSVPMRTQICAGPENFEVLRLLAEARP